MNRSFVSHATTFTLSTLSASVRSLNSALLKIKVHILSQYLYAFKSPLKLIFLFTLPEMTSDIARSNFWRTFEANWCDILPLWISSSRLSCKVSPRVVFLYGLEFILLSLNVKIKIDIHDVYVRGKIRRKKKTLDIIY